MSLLWYYTGTEQRARAYEEDQSQRSGNSAGHGSADTIPPRRTLFSAAGGLQGVQQQISLQDTLYLWATSDHSVYQSKLLNHRFALFKPISKPYILCTLTMLANVRCNSITVTHGIAKAAEDSRLLRGPRCYASNLLADSANDLCPLDAFSPLDHIKVKQVNKNGCP